MMPLTGHVTTAASVFVVWYTHAVEYSEVEVDAVGEDDTLPVDDATKPPVFDADSEAESETDAARVADTDLLAGRDADTDAEADTLKPRVGDVDGDGDGETSTHCT